MGDQYFESRAQFRAWLADNHDSPDELWVGFYKKGSGKPSVTYEEAVEEALCFGWIDGVRHAVDGERYRQRFTKRRKGSAWSAVNIRRMQGLIEQGLASAAGLAAFEARDPAKTQQSPSADGPLALSSEYEALIRERPGAWEFLQAQPPGYRRMAAAIVMSAKREETRLRRLQIVIAASERGVRLDPTKPLQVPEASEGGKT